MTLKKWFLNVLGATAREQKIQAAKDMELAKKGWKSLAMYFREADYNPQDWLASPLGSTAAEKALSANNHLVHLNLHPLASYRALSFSHVVDHWVPLVATEGWAILTQGRPYVLERLGPPKQWAHIEHPAFWREVVSLLKTNDKSGGYSKTMLQHAGWAGNLVPFEAMPLEKVEDYSLSGKTCHPRVALWLHSKGFWQKEHLFPSLGNWNDLFPFQGEYFLQWNSRTAVPAEYVLDWIEPILEHYPLSQEQKVSLIGQAFLAFGADIWKKHFAKACAPHLEGIDLNLLRAVCGNTTEHSTPLEMTVAALTQDVSLAFNPDTLVAQHLPNATMHQSFLLLREVQSPQNRAQLYTLADWTLKMESGLIAMSESIALPNLEN